jgi:hypothetical protein
MKTKISSMKNVIACAALSTLLLCANAFASDMFRFGSRLVVVGDPVTKLIDLAGEPLYKEPIQNEYGAFEGERWQYKIDGAVVTFIIRNAKVNRIDQAPRD